MLASPPKVQARNLRALNTGAGVKLISTLRQGIDVTARARKAPLSPYFSTYVYSGARGDLAAAPGVACI